MTYNNITQARFIRRINRFVAEVSVNDQTHHAHIKNTGRCHELLIPGAKIYLNYSDNPARATAFDLISVYKNNTLINIDSSAPNKAFLEYLSAGHFMPNITKIKPEAKFGTSRLDFYAETPTGGIFFEVKGVTLEENSVAKFPDAPTLRGIKHLQELTTAIQQGYQAHVVFIIKMQGITHFTPNYATHPEFGEALASAISAGVQAHAFDCIVTPNSLTIANPVNIVLQNNAEFAAGLYNS
ncbi:MAG: DNA/RNA nuclease SfsA [Defluviitaleaceae bacterium]|nr:DNA/RNA nuclease SfsA [Defluviitaleaceae bacterium]